MRAVPWQVLGVAALCVVVMVIIIVIARKPTPGEHRPTLTEALGPTPTETLGPTLMETLGIRVRVSGEAGEKVHPLIPKGTILPAERTGPFVTAYDMQTEITVELLKGLSPDPSRNESLGTWWVRGIPPARRGSVVRVTYTVEEDGAVTVRAKLDGRLLPVQAPPGSPFLRVEKGGGTSPRP